jgi:hypothetical protein
MKDGKNKGGVRNTRTGFFPHVLSIGGFLLPPHTQTAGQHIFVLVMVNDNIKIRIYKTAILPVIVYGCETWSHIKRGTY